MEQTELFISGKMSAEEKKAFTVRLLIEPSLYEGLRLQRCSYQLIRHIGRQHTKQKLENIFSQLMQEPAFKAALQQIYP